MILDLSGDAVTWVALWISSDAGALGVEAINIKIWLIRFHYVLEELRAVVSDIVDCM